LEQFASRRLIQVFKGKLPTIVNTNT
jgi:hypothetical protein